MELVAAIEALRSLPIGVRIDLHSDSQYLIYGMQLLYLEMGTGWLAEPSRKRDPTPPAVEGLTLLNAKREVRWVWLKGHNGHREQTRADALAYQAARACLVAGESRGLGRSTKQPIRRRSTDMASIAEANSLFEIDMELDALLEEIELQIESEGEPSEELVGRFQEFCEAHGEKVDRIGRFVAHDGSPRTVLPERSGATQRPSTLRSKQNRAHQEYGALLPAEPRSEEDRGSAVHLAGPEEQPGLGANHRRGRAADVLLQD